MMIEANIYDMPYVCRTKDLLWAHETRMIFSLLMNDGLSMNDIKQKIEDENTFNAASASRAKEIRQALIRRNNAVDDEFRNIFLHGSIEIQKVMCAIMIMLTDRTFYEFMDLVYREKLITGDLKLTDSDVIGFIHEIQSKDDRASKWTDAGIKKLRTQYLMILREGGLLSIGDLKNQKLLKPILSPSFTDYLDDNGLERVHRILTGERA